MLTARKFANRPPQLCLMLLLLMLVVLTCCTHTAAAYKFLGIFHTNARSHHILSSTLMRGLVERGHEVTVISKFPLEKPLPNYHEINLSRKPGDQLSNIEIANLFNMLNKQLVRNQLELHRLGSHLVNGTLSDAAVQALLQSNQTFDAVICEVSVSDALYGFAEHFRAPLIGLTAFGAHPWNTDMIGSPSPPSYVPSPMLHYTDRMTLWQRVVNLAYLTFERLMLDYYSLPMQEAIYKQYFPHAKLTLQQARTSAALILSNQHVAITSSRPYMPNQIEVGGMHIKRQRTPLPADLQRFLDEAEDGAIYFSLGSNLRSKDLPAEKRHIVLQALRSLKQRVLWKFEAPELPDRPHNVYISDWFPQDDVLAHPNVRAFITHGGLHSIMEAVYHGKPIVGLPVFGDQFLNVARAVREGYGLSLDYKQLTAHNFAAAVEHIVGEPSYTQSVRNISVRFRDQPEEPLTRAIYWVEHVVRHKGARYMRCAGLDLPLWQYHNVDAIVILYGGVLLLLAVVLRVLLALTRARRRCVLSKNTQQKIKRS